jgi:hypothetical protein
METATKAISRPRCGRAKPRTRFRVYLENGLEPLLALVRL